MENQMQTKSSNQMSTHVNQADRVLRSDILVPYIVLGQGLSEAVLEKKVQLGDIYRSTNAEVLGSVEKPIEAIFLHNPKTNWVLEQKVGNKFQYRRTIERNAENEVMEWNFTADDDGNELPAGTRGASEWRRVKQLLVFAVLPKDIAAAQVEMKKAEKGELPDPTKALTPVVFSFRSFSYQAGREVSTFFSKAKSMKVPIHKYKLTVGTYLDKNDDGAFYVWKVDASKPKGATKEELEVIEEWVSMIAGGATIATDETAENANAAPTATTKVEKEVRDSVM